MAEQTGAKGLTKLQIRTVRKLVDQYRYHLDQAMTALYNAGILAEDITQYADAARYNSDPVPAETHKLLARICNAVANDQRLDSLDLVLDGISSNLRAVARPLDNDKTPCRKARY